MKLSEFNELFEKLTLDYTQQAQALLKSLFQEFWDRNPFLKAVTWTQYTPYFNDGETCEFSVGDVTFLNTDEMEEILDVQGSCYEGSNPEVLCFQSRMMLDKEFNREYGMKFDIEFTKGFSNILESPNMESTLQTIFGDHVVVIATREGFDTLEYDHE